MHKLRKCYHYFLVSTMKLNSLSDRIPTPHNYSTRVNEFEIEVSSQKMLTMRKNSGYILL